MKPDTMVSLFRPNHPIRYTLLHHERSNAGSSGSFFVIFAFLYVHLTLYLNLLFHIKPHSAPSLSHFLRNNLSYPSPVSSFRLIRLGIYFFLSFFYSLYFVSAFFHPVIPLYQTFQHIRNTIQYDIKWYLSFIHIRVIHPFLFYSFRISYFIVSPFSSFTISSSLVLLFLILLFLFNPL